MRKIALLGADGQLGTDLAKEFLSEELVCLTKADADITDASKLRDILSACKPDVVINAAGYNDVPASEKNPDFAFAVNACAVKTLAASCAELGAVFVQYSSDYVFDGDKGEAYTEADAPNPLNSYGTSKLCGEHFAQNAGRHYVLRLSSLFGTAGCMTKGGTNFVEAMLKLGNGNKTAEITANIFSSPTYTVDAASKTREILDKALPSGIYHISNAGDCSWAEFAHEIFSQAGMPTEVVPKAEDISRAGVRRPACSSLSSEKIIQPRQ